MYAQIIDDEAGRTLVSASTVEKELFGAGKFAGNKDAAVKVGQTLAARAIERGIKEVVFDRGPYKYHGRVQAAGGRGPSGRRGAVSRSRNDAEPGRRETGEH